MAINIETIKYAIILIIVKRSCFVFPLPVYNLTISYSIICNCCRRKVWHTHLYVLLLYVAKKYNWLINITICVLVLAILFGAIVVGGYVVYGHTINPNILMSLGDSWLSYAAIVLMAGHLILGFVIIVKPVSEQVESFFNTSHSKHHII